MGAVTVVCAWSQDEAAVEWLYWVLAGRLDDNLTDTWGVRAGRLYWDIRHEEHQPLTWQRGTGWLERLDGSFWDRLCSNPFPEVRAANLAADPNTKPSQLEALIVNGGGRDLGPSRIASPGNGQAALENCRRRVV